MTATPKGTFLIADSERVAIILNDVCVVQKSKKAEEVATKRQLTHFQLRCLDLVETFIARQHSSNPLVLDLVLPLLDVVHVASRDPNKETLAEKASVLLRYVPLFDHE
ncbi:unnamed protein product [Clavelina lepadiformis]|uniref:Uncharacterized protein n=1 Tax=Clavelina lepadiformis TaxID=159417 RepID=A0ABP0FFW7_CLALP